MQAEAVILDPTNPILSSSQNSYDKSVDNEDSEQGQWNKHSLFDIKSLHFRLIRQKYFDYTSNLIIDQLISLNNPFDYSQQKCFDVENWNEKSPWKLVWYVW